MAKYLVIVESPAKAKTIKKFLGSNYMVEASMGHVRDLPKSQFGVNIEKGFEPKYITIRGKGDLIKKLKTQAKKADRVYLATDPDREGEAIAWHLAEILELNPRDSIRIAFNEITKDAVKEASKKPRNLDLQLIEAQQARRILDRIVGYKLSPLLWAKIKKGLSAGRVQSVAVRLIAEREEEINSFSPEEYWTIEGIFNTTNGDITAKLNKWQGEKPLLPNEEETNKILNIIKTENFIISDVEKKERKRNPAPPFTTSTLQQEAWKRLNFAASRTMRVAQELYEGVEIGKEGSLGLITYMRTDSVRVSDQAVEQARRFLQNELGETYVPKDKRVYQTGKKAQDAHEAIRPSYVDKTPANLKAYLSRDQYRLYELIWMRFLSSQAESAVFDTISIKINSSSAQFTASGSTLKFPGFLKLYPDQEKETDSKLPSLKKGTAAKLKDVKSEQHFTQPPPRYSQASLVKELEELGIGRPSTYATIIETIKKRGYVVEEEKRFVPTELGQVTVDLLKDHFSDIVDVDFTRELEEKLDNIEDGQSSSKEILAQFYDAFELELKKAEKLADKVSIADETTDEPCPNCGRFLVVKMGRFGKFLACPGFPDCKFTKPLLKQMPGTCPLDGGNLVERRSKKGRVFYGCANYPNCEFSSWYPPTKKNCPKCGTTMAIKGRGAKKELICLNKDCGYSEAAGDE
jgi:DNA topoisomerase-1